MNRIPTVLLALILTACSTPHTSEPPPAQDTNPAIPPGHLDPGDYAAGHPGRPRHDGTASSESVQPHAPATPEDVLAAATAAERFVQGWLTADPDQRRAQLIPVASAALVDAFDSPLYQPVHAELSGPAHVTAHGAFHITTRHRLSTGQVVEVDLQSEPDAAQRWIATAIRER